MLAIAKMKISDWLREFRMKNGLSQAALGRYAELGPGSQVSMWENDLRNPDYEDILKLAAYSGADKDELISLWRGDVDSVSVPLMEFPPKLIDAWRRMEPWQKEWLAESAALAVQLHEQRVPYEANPQESPSSHEPQPPRGKRRSRPEIQP